MNDKSVFISYRRKYSSNMAQAVFMALRDRGCDVFRDVDSINSGNFEQVIKQEISSRPNFIMIITEGSLDEFSDKGSWFRKEFECARAAGRNIIPLLDEDVCLDKLSAISSEDPHSISALNAVRVPHDYFEAAIDKLYDRFLVSQTKRVVPEIIKSKIQRAVALGKPKPEQLQAEKLLAAAFKASNPERILLCSKIIAMDQGCAEAYNLRALAYYMQGNLDISIPDWKEATKLKPDEAIYLNNLGVALFDNGKTLEALQCFDKANGVKPEWSTPYFNRADSLEKLNRQAESLQAKTTGEKLFVKNTTNERGSRDVDLMDKESGMRTQGVKRIDEGIKKYQTRLIWLCIIIVVDGIYFLSHWREAVYSFLLLIILVPTAFFVWNLLQKAKQLRGL
jgi:tetratricopeptide (TPR) repeat protein